MVGALAGKRIVVTRPPGQASQLADRLAELCAIPVRLPAIDIAPPADFDDVDGALNALDEADWVVFTSVNGVAAIADRMEQLGISPEQLNRRHLAVIGPATAEATEKAFRTPDLVPDEYVSEAISEALGDVTGQRFLLLRADIARKDLAADLRAKGAEVREVAVYRIVADTATKLDPNEPTPNYITLTSSSSVHATLAKLREAGRENWMREVPLACIGPITAQTVVDLGFPVTVHATEYTIPGLIAALVEHAEKESLHA